jgi:hypothetical protein
MSFSSSTSSYTQYLTTGAYQVSGSVSGVSYSDSSPQLTVSSELFNFTDFTSFVARNATTGLDTDTMYCSLTTVSSTSDPPSFPFVPERTLLDPAGIATSRNDHRRLSRIRRRSLLHRRPRRLLRLIRSHRLRLRYR